MKGKNKNMIKYFSLKKRNSDNEVYTAPWQDADENPGNLAFDHAKAMKCLNFYFHRINEGIDQQLQSPKVPEEVKKTLKHLDENDYEVSLMELWNEGGYFKKSIWTKTFDDFAKMSLTNTMI